MTIRSTRLQKYMQSNAAADQTPPEIHVAAAPSNMMVVEGNRSATIIPYGNAASSPDDNTFTVNVYLVRKGLDPQLPAQNFHMSQKLGSALCTMCTAVGAANTLIGAADHYCDTIVWTPTTWGTDLLTAWGATVKAVSPTGNIPGELMISDMANAYGLVLIFTGLVGSGEADEANALVQMDV